MQEQLSKSALSFYLFSSRETRSFFRFQFPVLFAPLSRCVSSYASPPLYGCPLCGAPPFISAPSAKLISLLKTNPSARRCCALVCSSRFHSFSPLRAFLRSPSDRWFVSCSLEWNRVCHHILTHTHTDVRAFAYRPLPPPPSACGLAEGLVVCFCVFRTSNATVLQCWFGRYGPPFRLRSRKEAKRTVCVRVFPNPNQLQLLGIGLQLLHRLYALWL